MLLKMKNLKTLLKSLKVELNELYLDVEEIKDLSKVSDIYQDIFIDDLYHVAEHLKYLKEIDKNTKEKLIQIYEKLNDIKDKETKEKLKKVFKDILANLKK